MVISMMLQLTEEEKLLYGRLNKVTDEGERKRIQTRLDEIYDEQMETLKDCPFAH